MRLIERYGSPLCHSSPLQMSIKSTLFAIFAFTMMLAYAASNGYNDKIDWINDLTQAKTIAKEQNKPILTMIVKSWCGACKRLQSQFQTADDKLVEMSKKFVMVNLKDDAEPKDAAYAPDGGYIPRIIYSDVSGTVRPEFSNTRRPDSYKYFYSDVPSVIEGMERALQGLQ